MIYAQSFQACFIMKASSRRRRLKRTRLYSSRKFVEGDDAVGRLSVPKAHEFAVGLLGSLLPIDHIWVLAHVVDARDVVKGHQAILVDVELVVGLADPASAASVEITAESSEELIEGDSVAAVAIEVRDEGGDLLLAEVNVEVLQTPHELVGVQLPVSIIVQDAEDASDAANRHRASSLERLLDVVDHLLAIVSLRGLHRLGTCSILREHHRPDVLVAHCLVLALANFLSVVLAGEHLGLVLGSGAHARDLKLVAEVVTVGDSIVRKELSRGAVLDHNEVAGEDGLASLGSTLGAHGLNLPHSVVGRLVEEETSWLRENLAKERGETGYELR
eukprot:CAMPEP_0170460346 /NCGR_PEP_ID=MMETSP0123-20130129/6744_1 /TAXON_ID=182087 /ORGANISM="Favella ehrenbergii, Strain Fehren 1" /LENGTH=331 /DNA_ID=CAMNT_0010725259 /DNA_START=170 /DNA_END=1168 /DNA_ORIENTATION=+